jgi:hypothetical protein
MDPNTREALVEPATGDPEGILDETVRRWLVAVQLLVRGEEAASRGTAVDESIALILADDASEALLSLLASHSGVTPSRAFDTLVNQAIATVKEAGVGFPPGLSVTLKTAHEARNGAMHHGLSNPSASAIQAARRLMDLMPRVSGTYAHIPPGVGLLGAVAALIAPAREVAHVLREADAAARANAWRNAGDAGAKALYLALSQTKPAIQPPRKRFIRPSVGADDLSGYLEPLTGQIDALSAWVIPMALGLRPAIYSEMRRVLGEAHEYMDNSIRVSPITEEPISDQEIRTALDELAMVIVRLWLSGTLFRGSRRAAFGAGIR